MDFSFIKQLADKFTKIYEWLISIIVAKENVDVVVVTSYLCATNSVTTSLKNQPSKPAHKSSEIFSLFTLIFIKKGNLRFSINKM